MLSSARRQEIATFLRTRRARVKPHDVGMPAGPRRRTPGLRREEVATAAGVNVEWYTWLEQARDVRASHDALERIAGALQLEPSATRHLLTLAGYSATPNGEAEHPVAITGHLQQMLDRLDPYPAWIYGERWDVVAWNRAATVIYGDFASAKGLERNLLYSLFLNPAIRCMVVEWPRAARGVVAKVRSAYARFVDDPWYHEIINLLCQRSPEFADWWNAQEVHPYRDGIKEFDHPHAGRLSFAFSALDLRDERFANLTFVTYVPRPGTGTLEKMQHLVDGISESATTDSDARAMLASP